MVHASTYLSLNFHFFWICGETAKCLTSADGSTHLFYKLNCAYSQAKRAFNEFSRFLVSACSEFSYSHLSNLPTFFLLRFRYIFLNYRHVWSWSEKTLVKRSDTPFREEVLLEELCALPSSSHVVGPLFLSNVILHINSFFALSVPSTCLKMKFMGTRIAKQCEML